MSGTTSLSKVGSSSFSRLTMGIMVLLTLVLTAVAMGFDAYQSQYVRVVKVSNLLGLIFLTLLSRPMFSKTVESDEPKLYLTLFYLDIYMASLSSTLLYCLLEVPQFSQSIKIVSTLCYFFLTMIYPILWLHQKQFFRETLVTRTVSFIIYSITFIYIILLITNIRIPILFSFTEQGGLSDKVSDYISLIITIICLTAISIAIAMSDVSMNRKLSFFCCIITPLVLSSLSLNQYLFSWGTYIIGVVTLTVLLPLYLVFLNEHDELENDVLRHEKKQVELQVSAMISQMQPHFLYNSLAVIEALCDQDPKLAAEATNKFSNYLRENMDFADKSTPIPFSEELSHIETYVWLERLRFPHRLNVVFDIACSDFYVPALSVQPMVENAIKHGICKSKTAGTVTIRTYETTDSHIVTVTDDGCGFDVLDVVDDGHRHVGIENTRWRLQMMVGATLGIASAPGGPTTVKIEIPKRDLP